MAVDIKFEDGRVIAKNLPKPKKITGTRFGAVLDANDWQTPFQAWCEMTKVWCKPFEDTIYTEAGKIIEDKQLTWFSRYLPVVRPADVYGKDFFKKTFGDFFKKEPIFGGMWDSIVGTKDNYEAVIECKTTKRSEDWKDDIPQYYALQAALYAYLLKLDDVCMIVTFLEDKDYENPEAFECNADNTTYIHFKVSERYPNFQEYVDYCKTFWDTMVLTGISPLYDQKKDKEYIDALRTTVVDKDTDLDALVKEADELYDKLDRTYESIKEDESRLKKIEEMLKKYAVENDNGVQTKTVFQGSRYSWTVTRSERVSVDSAALKADGLYEKYTKKEQSYKINKTKNKDGEDK